MTPLQDKYITFLSSRFRNFRKKSSTVYNFSCPICGDSKSDKRKARAYLYEKNDGVWFVCHNCNAPIGSFENFLKTTDNFLFSEFIREKYGERTKKTVTKEVTSVNRKHLFYDAGELKELTSIDKLSDFNPAKQYVVSRQIPEEHHSRLYSCNNFKEFTNSLLPEKFSKEALEHDEQRLIIPFFDEAKKMFAYAGRSLEKDPYLRYINIVLDETKPKIYGLDRWDKTKPTLVVEGPIDSLFLPNCIATAGGNLISSLRGYDKNLFTIVYDNEPRSKTTKEKINKAIEEGYKVCIWPVWMKHKDINKMVLEGLTKEEILYTIHNHTYTGLQATLNLSFWSRR